MGVGVKAWTVLLPGLLLTRCNTAGDNTLFTLVDARQSGITFENTLSFREDFNIIEYPYFYDGGGVALGDINRDGFQDIFFTGNQVSDRLYINKGGLEFEDITASAGIASGGWSTGVTMADVNGDGWLDLYVCQVSYKSLTGQNRLYINNQNNTFTESAVEYGLAFEGLSTQAAFFDYDRDNDLDLYLLNHAVHSSESFVPSWRRTVDAPRVGDHLYRNEDGTHFTNVTTDAGIYSSALGYGLGLAISDINDDGWPDIYVGNDFHENDYLYLNRGDGTFAEVLQHTIGHTSQSTMGVDIADLNNDRWPEVVALDMMPPDWAAYQASGGPDEEGVARIKRRLGYAPQVTRNTLQLHRGLDAVGLPLFSEIGAFLGIHATDWSWAPLVVDLDGDGWKDLFVTNGIPRRPNDLDYIEYVVQPSVQKALSSGSAKEVRAVIARMPEVSIGNYAFRNRHGAAFSDVSRAWGLDLPGVSNGAAYGDLDNDGDVDMVVNNLNQAAFVYRNNSGDARYLRVTLEGAGLNTTGIGARVTVYAGSLIQTQEQVPTRGFQSSVAHDLTFGLGTATLADSLEIRWPDGLTQTLHSITANHHLLIRQSADALPYSPGPRPASLFTAVPGAIAWKHQENDYEDFAYEPLMPHRLSREGPALAVADVDGDTQDDVFLGGAHAQTAVLLLRGTQPVPLESGKASEDVDAAFFDADGDGDNDLYVVRGGGQQDSALWQDRLFLNDGHGRFSAGEGLPHFLANGCCVSVADYDADGDMDLFVGSRSMPGSYGQPPRSYLLRNEGAGAFADVTLQAAPFLLSAGMITDAAWANVTGDSAPDLIIVGEWMPVTVLENRGGRLTDATEALGLAETAGWWLSVMPGDFDRDGDVDLVAGNLGLNSVLSGPMDLFVGDFDSDGRTEPLIVWSSTDKLWARRDALLNQLPGLSGTVPTYTAYANARASDLVDLDAARRSRVRTFASLYLENQETFAASTLPDQVQWSSVMDMISGDFDHSGTLDVLAVGNFYGAGAAQGRYDASFGTLLLNRGDGVFTAASNTGLSIRGEARSVQVLQVATLGTALIVALTNDHPQVFRVPSP